MNQLQMLMSLFFYFPANNDNNNNNNTISFKFKEKITGKTSNDGTKDVKIMVSLKY